MPTSDGGFLMSETNTWYYGKSGQQLGPIDITALQSLLQQGAVLPHDPVWRPGMADWQPANMIPELAAYMPAAQIVSPQPFAAQPAMLNYRTAQVTSNMQYAGFWLRFAAYVIDYLITIAIAAVVGFGIGILIVSSGGHVKNNPAFIPTRLGIQGVSLIATWLYYALMESSSTQGSLGKMAVGIRVVDLAGERISFGRATGRYFGKLLSTLILCIGFMMAGWTERKQALHDIMANCLVVRR